MTTTTTTINATMLNETAKAKNEAREKARIERLENHIVNTVLPKCKRKAEDGQFNHREEFFGYISEEITKMMAMLEELGFKVSSTSNRSIFIEW